VSVPENHYHAVQFYKDGASLAKTVARFFEEGLRAGQPAVMVATPSHTKAIVHALSAGGCNVHSLRRKGQLQTLDADKVLTSFMVGGTVDPVLFKSNVGDVIERLCQDRKPCPIRAYGEMVDLLWQRGNADAAIRLEILWNQLASNYEFSLLCGYAVGQFYKETRDPRYADICAQHSDVLPA
jgi:MEDS: MEthanogen/methylotroph, DcmR Sensory domain